MSKVKLITGLIVAVVVGAGIYWLLKSVRMTPYEDVVIQDVVTVDFAVAFFKQNEEGQLSPWTLNQRVAGDVVVPYVKGGDAIAVVMLHKRSDDQYELIADAEWTKRDQDYFFTADGEAVSVTLRDAPEEYCVLGVIDMPLMGIIIQQLPRLDLEARNARLECFSL